MLSINKFVHILLDAYCVIIGSFFSIFVPQLCDHKINNLTVYNCSIIDNYSNLSLYNKFVLCANIITAISLTISFIFEFYREHWINNHFDIDKEKPVDNLHVDLNVDSHHYRFLKKKIGNINYCYFLLFNITTILNVINIILSAVLANQYYGGLQTVTTFMTNTLIILFRFMKSVEVSHVHRNDFIVQSVFLLVPRQFNIIHPNFQLGRDINDNDIDNEVVIIQKETII